MGGWGPPGVLPGIVGVAGIPGQEGGGGRGGTFEADRGVPAPQIMYIMEVIQLSGKLLTFSEQQFEDCDTVDSACTVNSWTMGLRFP